MNGRVIGRARRFVFFGRCVSGRDIRFFFVFAKGSFVKGDRRDASFSDRWTRVSGAFGRGVRV